ncbi:MAG: glycosyltransferase family 39 protein [Solirubrobacterales bacterium]
MRGAAERTLNAVRAFWPTGAPGWILLGLVVAGLVVRGFAAYAWSPTVHSLADSSPYAGYAASNPLDNPQHPAGYSAFLAMVGVVSREITVTMVLQGLLGLASALLLFAATRRIAGPWPALVPAAVVLLGGDQVLLERAVMSETLFTFVLAAALYACVRAFEREEPWWGWPLAAGVLVALTATVRSAGTFLVPVAVVALLFSRPRPWLPRWRPVAALAAGAAAVLIAYAGANAAARGSFELGPSQGWHLYSRAASFADCDLFTPPEGTEGLCEEKPPERRLGGSWYTFNPKSPVVREFGHIGNEDELVGQWAREAILSQPGSYLRLVWRDFRAFFVPTSHGGPLFSGHGLDPTLDWRVPLVFVDAHSRDTLRNTEAGIESFFDDFEIEIVPSALETLHDYQRVFRFGATALSACAILALLGLFVGPRRSRVGVFLLAAGSVALLVSPAIAGIYVGRYTVPLAGPMAAAGAIAAVQLLRVERARRAVGRSA